ncbi:MAG: 4-hydroxy-tetrahydrodipicolinate reductase [Sulfobacillus acidophilus]|uniref:4-hydroxy-tetrahydrodipicolinate reductase n=1 Tax=Sulfobacillus acidophilus TaxID=53633 RepID=A0A2T2WPC7_9FIRM|nr:MAG: 4-hydroxy-tetrahydrodipicolinate reductase [Sulfobacillus acidophilus]
MKDHNMIPVVLAGATGKTGRAVGQAIHQATDMKLLGALSSRYAGVDLGSIWGENSLHLPLVRNLQDIQESYAVLVDFTEPQSALQRILQAIDWHWDLVVGTTGFSRDGFELLSKRVEQAGVGAAVIANFSLGAWVAQRLAQEASRYFSAVEVIEGHHPTKRDRPSGTARAMTEILGASLGRPTDTIPVHSLRLPGMVAHQAVVFGSPGQMLTIRHDVHDRSAYVDGVLAAIRRVHQVDGLITDLGEVLQVHADPPNQASH